MSMGRIGPAEMSQKGLVGSKP